MTAGAGRAQTMKDGAHRRPATLVMDDCESRGGLKKKNIMAHQGHPSKKKKRERGQHWIIIMKDESLDDHESFRADGQHPLTLGGPALCGLVDELD